MRIFITVPRCCQRREVIIIPLMTLRKSSIAEAQRESNKETVLRRQKL